jgi:hypothetical protein
MCGGACYAVFRMRRLVNLILGFRQATAGRLHHHDDATFDDRGEYHREQHQENTTDLFHVFCAPFDPTLIERTQKNQYGRDIDLPAHLRTRSHSYTTQ